MSKANLIENDSPKIHDKFYLGLAVIVTGVTREDDEQRAFTCRVRERLIKDRRRGKKKTVTSAGGHAPAFPGDRVSALRNFVRPVFHGRFTRVNYFKIVT